MATSKTTGCAYWWNVEGSIYEKLPQIPLPTDFGVDPFGVWRDTQFRVEARSEYVDVREQITVKAALGATRLDNKTVFLMPCKEA